MLGQEIRNRLHGGQRVYGTHVCSLTNPVTAAMQSGLEYDYIFICNEHMPIDRTETAMMCQYYAARDISPCVRVPCPDPIQAAMALDGGAQGIVAPYVETVDQVQAMVGAVKYRPVKGRQLEEFLEGRREPNEKLTEFFNRFNRHNYLIIGVESVAAYENLDSLIAVPGVDGVFIGPHDMSVSLGIPEEYEAPEFDALVSDVIRRCRAAGVGVGIHMSQVTADDQAFIRRMQQGMNWILYGADVALLVAAMRQNLQGLRDAMGDSYERQQASAAETSSCLGDMKRQRRTL